MNKLALLPYFTTFQLRIYEFPVKKEPDSFSTLGQMMGARCLHLLVSVFLDSKWRTRISSFSGNFFYKIDFNIAA